MCQTVLKHVQVMKAKHSTLETKHFVKGGRDPLSIMTIRVMRKQCWTRWTYGLPNSRVTTFCCEACAEYHRSRIDSEKLRTIQIDMLFNKIYDKTNPFTRLVQNQRKWFRIFGTSNYVNCSRRNPKTQCTVCLSYWNIGILYRTCGHFLHKERGTNPQFINYTINLLSVPEYVIKMGRPQGHRHGKKLGNKEYCTFNQLKKLYKKRIFPRNPWPILIGSRIPCPNDWTSSRRRPLSTMGYSCGLKITLTISPHKNTSTIRANEGFIQISKVLILCEPDFRQALSTPATIATRSRRRITGALLLQTPTMGGTQFIFHMVELARFMVDSSSFRKSRRRCTKCWVNGTTCCLQY